MELLYYLSALRFWETVELLIKVCVLGLSIRFVLKVCILQPIDEMRRTWKQ
ncbi:hypothetical protein QGZ99_05595 [Kingella kingae]|uniref:Octanoyltransferase n=2 Tax=Kingella kingae TaxID=504 RepID=F5S4B5_KINKI|nr:hypothetical protein [Kingella kingae]EGK12353.1 octanoyltransferase [Kingella kingae ATCC 23330]MDK4534565.1 hypothetical protein [Kingella kingae]MDK4541060.1 hypothetical protein [Kingella kingae]MDK4553589.1 hypothetical protein [Kingella kingae]UOP02467.1 hypothetical protein LVJ79_07585 [Kingella kingae]